MKKYRTHLFCYRWLRRRYSRSTIYGYGFNLLIRKKFKIFALCVQFKSKRVLVYLWNGRHRRRRLGQIICLFSRVSRWNFYFGNGVEHVIKSVSLIIIQRHGPSVTLGNTPFGQKSRRHSVTSGPRLYAGRHSLSVGHSEFQGRVKPLAISPPFQQTRSRRSGRWRTSVTGQ